MAGADVASTARGAPFWSPDSRFIAFFSNSHKIRKIPAAGGTVQTICDTSTFGGGTWNQDGTILFGVVRKGLMRVPQLGGEPVPVTSIDRSGGEIDHHVPHFLPDGRHFLYMVLTAQSGTGGIFLGSLDSGEKKRLVGGVAASLGWAPPEQGSKQGHLLFIRENVLMAQPVNAATLEQAGEPFPLAERVNSVAASANGVLAYSEMDVTGVRTQPRWLDRTGKLSADAGPPGDIRDLQLSPDGKLAAISVRDASSAGLQRRIWIMDAARGTRSRLTFDPAEQRFVIWSPDGTFVVYASGAGRAHDLILLKRADGSGDSRPLKTGGVDFVPQDWSGDGKWLLYGDLGATTQRDLWVLPLGVPPGGKSDEKAVPFLQSQYSEENGAFSPDARWIAYVSDEQGRAEIFVQSFPPGQGKFQISNGGGAQPKWRRDGRQCTTWRIAL